MSGWVGAGYDVVSNAKKGKFTTDYFNNLLKENSLVLVDFASRHCPGCLKLQPEVEKVRDAFKGRVLVEKVEMDENMDVIKEQKIKLLPTLRLYKNGKLVWEHSGLLTAEDIEAELNKYL